MHNIENHCKWKNYRMVYRNIYIYTNQLICDRHFFPVPIVIDGSTCHALGWTAEVRRRLTYRRLIDIASKSKPIRATQVDVRACRRISSAAAALGLWTIELINIANCCNNSIVNPTQRARVDESHDDAASHVALRHHRRRKTNRSPISLTFTC